MRAYRGKIHLVGRLLTFVEAFNATRIYGPILDALPKAAVFVKPSRSARTSRCLTEEGCHRVPPRGVRSRMASSWGDLLERAVGSGCFDAGNEPDQAVVALLGLRTIQ